MSDFERDLELELHRILDPIAATPIPPRRAIESGGTMKKLLGSAGAALSVKVLTGFAVAAAAATLAGAATEAAITGSLNPADWGKQVSEQVETCKAQLAVGHHGIGECVSDFARQHGDLVSDAHASGARHHGDGKDKHKPKAHVADSNANGPEPTTTEPAATDQPKKRPAAVPAAPQH